MSVGNTNVDEWNALVDYCKHNKKETAHFFLDLIDCYEQEHKDGTRADNFVGFFNNIIELCFEEDGLPVYKGFFGCGNSQRRYKMWIEKYIL